MSEFTARGLVDYCNQALGWKTVYMWGGLMKTVTQAFIDYKKKQYPAYYSDSRVALLKTKIGNYYGCDCVGLIKSYLFGGINSPKYKSKWDTNTRGMYSVSKTKGTIGTLPEQPGLILYMKGHVGVYIGNGEAIECTLGKYGDGVVKTKVDGRGWTHWLQLPWLDYNDGVAPVEPECKCDCCCCKKKTDDLIDVWVSPLPAKLIIVDGGNSSELVFDKTPISLCPADCVDYYDIILCLSFNSDFTSPLHMRTWNEEITLLAGQTLYLLKAPLQGLALYSFLYSNNSPVPYLSSVVYSGVRKYDYVFKYINVCGSLDNQYDKGITTANLYCREIDYPTGKLYDNGDDKFPGNKDIRRYVIIKTRSCFSYCIGRYARNSYDSYFNRYKMANPLDFKDPVFYYKIIYT